MKSNKLLLFILLAIVVVFVGVAGWLYSANSSEVNKQNNLKQSITLNQKTLSQGKAANAAAETEAATLESEVANAQSGVDKVNFLNSAESIDFDRLLVSMSADNNLQITSLTATPPADTQDNNNTYQLTTFTVNVEGVAPQKIFASTADSVSYITATVNSIAAFAHEVASNPDFNTAEMPSVNLTAPAPMTDADIATLNAAIDSEVQAGLTAADTQGLTPDQITALVQSDLTKMTSGQIQALIEQAGFTAPNATITIKVWALKGA
jgi:hypothetical protein